MYVHSLSLEHVKPFRKLDFNFQRPNGTYAGLNVLVGGNASGKSTVLRAIALCLCGESFGRHLIKDTSGWIREGVAKARAQAEVKYDKSLDLFSSQGKLPHNPFKCALRWESRTSGEVSFRRGEPSTKGHRLQPPSRGPWSEFPKGWFAAGYGPMRRLTGSSAEGMRDAVGISPVCRFISLFREDVALSESELWLKNLQFKTLEKKPAANQLIHQIKAFLNDGLLPYGFSIEKIDSEHVYMQTIQGKLLPMRDLSEGYRCIYALMLDMIRHMFEVYSSADVFRVEPSGRVVVGKPGVVLIDELETHLHPSWQRIICEWLKERFPNVQFFVTTHSPLIVQAADPGGIYFLPDPSEKRKPHRFEDHEYDRIVMGRAERVLLGKAFGLSFTRGEWALKQMERYRILASKSKANALTDPSERNEFRRLGKQMEFVFKDGEGDAP